MGKNKLKQYSLILRSYLFAIDYKWLLLLGYYFFFDLGQEFFEYNSEIRIEFYNINLAAFFVLFGFYIWKDGLKLMNPLSHSIFKAATIYWIWDLGDNILNQGARIWRTEAMKLSVIFFVLMAVDFVWLHRYKKSIIVSLFRFLKRLFLTVFGLKQA